MQTCFTHFDYALLTTSAQHLMLMFYLLSPLFFCFLFPQDTLYFVLCEVTCCSTCKSKVYYWCRIQRVITEIYENATTLMFPLKCFCILRLKLKILPPLSGSA